MGALLILLGAGLIAGAISQTQLAAGGLLMLIGGLVALMFGVAAVTGDVLADHPDEAQDDLDEQRRRRGAAGWQKPVAPPSAGSRPGGLPPRRER